MAESSSSTSLRGITTPEQRENWRLQKIDAQLFPNALNGQEPRHLTFYKNLDIESNKPELWSVPENFKLKLQCVDRVLETPEK